MQHAQREMHSQEEKDIEENCIEKEEDRSCGEQETIVRNIEDQVHPIKQV